MPSQSVQHAVSIEGGREVVAAFASGTKWPQDREADLKGVKLANRVKIKSFKVVPTEDPAHPNVLITMIVPLSMTDEEEARMHAFITEKMAEPTRRSESRHEMTTRPRKT